jgi:hypothetical protein
MWFDVAMADIDLIQIQQTPEHLVSVNLKQIIRHNSLSVIVFYDTINCIGEVVHNNI